MTYAYDRDAMAQPSTLDPFRVATTLGFQHTHDDDDTMIDASTIVLTGPRGAEEFARMWAAHCATGQRTARLDSILRITIGDARTVRAQRQMIGILRWLLACAGYGEDVLQDAIVATLEDGEPTIGAIMAHAPVAIETRDWARREPARSSTPFEWLE